MNIFWLDKDLELAAQYHCDKHVVKMLLESVQILSTVLHQNGVEGIPYKPTHKNHPCVTWAGDTVGNFKKLTLFATKLSNEYTYRYGRKHKSAEALEIIFKLTNMNRELPLPDGPALRPPLCMPMEELDIEPWETVEDAYRTYYRYKQDSGMDMRWTNRDIPNFMVLDGA